MNFEVTLTTRSPRRSRDRWRRGWGAGSPSRCNTGSPTAAAGTASSSPTDTPVYLKKITSFILTPKTVSRSTFTSLTDTPVYWKKLHTSFLLQKQYQGQLLPPQQTLLCIEKNHILHSYSKNSFKVNFYLPNRHPCVLKKITSFIPTLKAVLGGKHNLHFYSKSHSLNISQPSFLL